MQTKKLLAALLSAAMAVTAAAVPVLAAPEDKTLTVDAAGTEGSDYTNVQDAIDYIYNLEDATEGAKSGWTINVQEGEYDAFVVPTTVDDITVQAADETKKPTIKFGYEGSPTWSKGNVLSNDYQCNGCGGVVLNGTGATLKNLVLSGGEYTNNDSWSRSAIGCYYEDNSRPRGNIVIDSCEFNGNDNAANAINGIFSVEVTNCVFDNFGTAYYAENIQDGDGTKNNVKITFHNNEFKKINTVTTIVPYANNFVGGTGLEIDLTGNTYTSARKEGAKPVITIQDYGMTQSDKDDIIYIKLDKEMSTADVVLIDFSNDSVKDEQSTIPDSAIRSFTNVEKALSNTEEGDNFYVNYSNAADAENVKYQKVDDEHYKDVNSNITYSTNAARIGTQEYKTIDAAIEAAQVGDTVIVLPGEHTIEKDTYIGISKSITLKGEDPEVAAISVGAPKEPAATINGSIMISEAEGVTIENLTLQNPAKTVMSETNLLLYVSGTHGTTTIKNCKFVVPKGTKGILTGSKPETVDIQNNTFIGNGVAAYLHEGNVINMTGNKMDGNGSDGKGIFVSAHADAVNITHNMIEGATLDLGPAKNVSINENDLAEDVCVNAYNLGFEKIDISGNYWGVPKPDPSKIFIDAQKNGISIDDANVIYNSYYETATVSDDDFTLRNKVNIPDDVSAAKKKVSFEQVKDAEDNPTNQIKVYLNGYITKEGEPAVEEAALIENLVAADLAFKLSEGFAITGFELGADLDAANWTYDVYDGNRYLIHEKGKDNGAADVDGEKIHLGTLTIGGYGDGIICANGGNDNAVEQRDRADNIVVSSKLPETSIDGEIAEDSTNPLEFTTSAAEKTLTINVMFPNKLADEPKNVNMSINIKGGVEMKDGKLGAIDKTINLDGTGNDKDVTVSELQTGFEYPDANGYTVTAKLPAGYRYTLTFKGDGYRTYTKDVVVSDDTTVTVWNNVMDEKTAVVSGSDPETTHTFLAGDIDNSQKIDLYDLSADVAYFGKTNVEGDFVRYDLNRDGAIDSKDIAMVLVSWNN